MAKPTGFIEYQCKEISKRPVNERIRDYKEIEQLMEQEVLINQAARCMDCGVPSCHSYGCPLNNNIPDWNDMVYRKNWKKALEYLHNTNNFPEITGRICPAPCEEACTLAIDNKPVLIRHIELQITEKGWNMGWIKPQIPSYKTGKKIAVIGSGPAGLAAAQQLARKGHSVVVFEKDDKPGGLLRYGIPDFKLEKHIIDRRIEQMKKEGVIFENKVEAGEDVSVKYMQRSFDITIIASGSREPRDLNIKGRDSKGICFAMDFLAQQNKRNYNETINNKSSLFAKDKDVVVIGGGDTGSDCIGTSIRQNAKSVTQIEILPKPPQTRAVNNPWPQWPNKMRTSSSHQEGCKRIWSINTKEFITDDKNNLKKLLCCEVEWHKDEKTGRFSFSEKKGSDFEIKADMAILSMGFVHPEHKKFTNDLKLATDKKGNFVLDNSNLMTSYKGVFAAGDCVLGASLVVRAIRSGRDTAEAVDRYLV